MRKSSVRGHKKGIFNQFRLWLDRSKIGEILLTKGAITSQELRFVLKQQKETNLPIGQILLNNNLITRFGLVRVLGRQHLLRFMAASFIFLASVSQTNKKAHAEPANTISAQFTLVSQNHGQYARMDYRPGLFGTEEKESKNLQPFTKWTSMFKRFERDLQNQSGAIIIKRWNNELRGFQGLSLKDMANQVNQLVNQKRYILDQKNWGKSDYWATPVEFLQRGGDCEDFAIAKYTALRSLGVPEERLRVAIVHDTVKNIPHAILAVYTDEGLFILDNQIKSLVPAESSGRYRPIFSINRQAWWLHTSPGATVLASAQ